MDLNGERERERERAIRSTSSYIQTEIGISAFNSHGKTANTKSNFDNKLRYPDLVDNKRTSLRREIKAPNEWLNSLDII